jgi:hypothetical protein
MMFAEKASHIVLISDLHVGALEAPMPLEYDDEGIGFDFREWVRARLVEFFEDFVPRITNGEPFVLVSNGDIIHGDWHRFGELGIRSIVKQTRAARDLIKPYAARAVATYLVEGTEVHTKTSESDIAEELLQIGNIRVAHDNACHKSLSLMLGGKHHRFRHHTNTAGRAWTEAGNQANHLADDILRCIRAGIQKPDVLCLAHRHVHGLTLDGNGMSIVTPAWSAVDRHARKVTREDFGCIGACVLSYAGRDLGEFPDVRFFTKSVVDSVAKPSPSGGSIKAKATRTARTDKQHPRRATGNQPSSSRATPRKTPKGRKSHK